MDNKDSTYKQLFLHPDKALFNLKDIRVATVLGSCVAITMYNKKMKTGSICHSSMPELPKSKGTRLEESQNIFKYVDSSIIHMYENYIELYGNSNDLEVKVFGGSSSLETNKNIFDIGNKNVEKAMYVFDKLKIKIIASDLGGNNGRKIVFDLTDGKVLLKRISNE